MVDIAVTSQLQQWTFDKPALITRPERSSSSSSASSPNLCDDAPETLRIDTSTTEALNQKPRKESVVLQERYLSSEEDLSPADEGSDSEYDYDDVVIHDAVKECKARTMSISRWDKGRSCDMAVMVSYSFAGRPKVVELDSRSPVTEGSMGLQQRSASVANIPIAAISELRKVEAAQRKSMMAMPISRTTSPPMSRSDTPSIDTESRRPSTSHSPITQKSDALHLTDTVSTASSFKTAPSSRSSTPPSVEPPLPSRPVTSSYETSSSRSSVYIPSQSRPNLSKIQTSQSSSRLSQWTPLTTPASPATHAFLSSDPYETSTATSASPIIKTAPHKRLRSISMKLTLAKIAISPSKKTYDARVNGKVPQTPTTPQTAPLEGSSSFVSPNRLRRASTILRPKSRHGDLTRGPSPEMAPPLPPTPISAMPQKPMSRMVARGANEIEPTLVLPPCPSDNDDDAMSSFKSRKIKKRKSLMSLMDSL